MKIRQTLPVGAVIAALLVVAAHAGDDRAPAPGASESRNGEPTTDEIRRILAAGGKLDGAALDRILQLQHTEVEKVRLVLLPVSVEDRRGRRVIGLTREDFKVYEDHVPQQIEFFSVEAQQPLALAFLLDVSGSMRQLDKLLAAKEAIRYFVEHLRPLDRFALICFADEQVSWVTPFTTDRQRFLERLDVQEGFGQTALNDAVAETPRLVFEDADRNKKAIVLITDGVDNFSQLTAEQAIAAAGRVQVPIYTIGFSALPEYVLEKGETVYNLLAIRRFSEETGGNLFVVHDPDELKEAVVSIEEELRHQYLIGYYPARKVWDGAYRSVRLETRNSRHQVRSRKGYYATP